MQTASTWHVTRQHQQKSITYSGHAAAAAACTRLQQLCSSSTHRELTCHITQGDPSAAHSHVLVKAHVARSTTCTLVVYANGEHTCGHDCQSCAWYFHCFVTGVAPCCYCPLQSKCCGSCSVLPSPCCGSKCSHGGGHQRQRQLIQLCRRQPLPWLQHSPTLIAQHSTAIASATSGAAAGPGRSPDEPSGHQQLNSNSSSKQQQQR